MGGASPRKLATNPDADDNKSASAGPSELGVGLTPFAPGNAGDGRPQLFADALSVMWGNPKQNTVMTDRLWVLLCCENFAVRDGQQKVRGQ